MQIKRWLCREEIGMIIPHEQYTLTLRHEYVDQDGQYHSLDEPIVVSYSVIHMDERSVPPSAIVINEMMEQMRKFMVERGTK